MYKRISIFLLAGLYFLLTVITCSAADRWDLIYHDETEGVTALVFIDSQTVTIYSEKTDIYLDCWIKYKIPTLTMLEHYYLHVDNFNYMKLEVYVYDKNGKLVKSKNEREKGWRQYAPDSGGETILKNAADWVIKHPDLVKWK